MKNKLLKAIAIILAMLTLSALFVACGTDKNEQGNNGTVSTQEAAETDPVTRLDWGGRPFKILATNNAHEPNFEITGVAGADKLSAKIFERNLIVEEYCNVVIQDVSGGEDAGFANLEKDFLGGTQAYDLVFLIRDEMSSAIQRGFMTDLNEVDYINTSNPWYSQLTIDSMKISGRLYHISSDYSLVDKARMNTLWFNRDMATELGITEDVVELVRAGTWTIDTMYTMAKKAAADLDGNGTPDKTDQYGVACGGGEGALAFYAGMGNTLVTVDDMGNYEVGISSEYSLSCLDKIRALLLVDDWTGFTGSESNKWTKDYDAPYDGFVDERVMFMASSMDAVSDLAADADFAYTAITFPKYDADQDHYYTTNDNTYCSTFGIPFGAGDVDFSGYMIEVLSWKSHDTTYPEYYEVKCLVQKSYDPVCAEMLQLNNSGLVYDFGLQYSNSVKYKKAVEKFCVFNTENKAMTTYIAECENASNAAIQGILDSVLELPNRKVG